MAFANYNAGKSLFPSGSQVAGTTYTADQHNTVCRGIAVVTSVTVDGGTGTLTVTVQGKDIASGSYYDILATTAVNIAAGLKRIAIYPGLAVSANASANDILPETWRLKFVVANSVTATVGASLEV